MTHTGTTHPSRSGAPDHDNGGDRLTRSSAGHRARRTKERRGAGALVAVLIGCAGLAACSTSDPQDQASIAPLTTATNTASDTGADPTPAQDATPPTAQDLSDPSTGFTIVFVPTDLDATQIEVLNAYIAYDQATWNAYRDMNGLDQVQATTTGAALDSYTASYNRYAANGWHAEGISSEEIIAVDATPGQTTASVHICGDQTQWRVVTSTGADETPETMKHRFGFLMLLTKTNDAWMVSEEIEMGAGTC